MNADVTQLLQAIEAGRKDSVPELLARVYTDLKTMAVTQMARETPGQTLQPTALVHEAWLRLVDEEGRTHFENRAHFFCAAAEAMRRVLVEHARRRRTERRGRDWERVAFLTDDLAAPALPEELLSVHDALDKLALVSMRKAELVKLRYFVGLTFEEAAAILGISVPTAERDWSYARAWLRVEIENA